MVHAFLCRQVLARYPKLNNLADSNLANSCELMKSGVLSRRKFLVALARSDGALSCMKTEDEIIVWTQTAALW